MIGTIYKYITELWDSEKQLCSQLKYEIEDIECVGVEKEYFKKELKEHKKRLKELNDSIKFLNEVKKRSVAR